MKLLNKNFLNTGAIMVAISFTGNVLAHTVSGSLGAAATATDVYKVTCSNEPGGITKTFRLYFRIKTGSGMKITATRGGASASATANNAATLAKGNGAYTMSVAKTTAGAKAYTAEFHCQGNAASGFIHTGTSSIQTQNQ